MVLAKGNCIEGLTGSISLASSLSEVSFGSRPLTETVEVEEASPERFFALTV